MGFISECAAGFVCAGRDGKIYIKNLYENEEEIPLNLFKTFEFADECKISKVSYENGVESFKFGDDSKNILHINQENLFIVDENQVQKIYNQIKDLTANSFEGTTIINPALDIGDKIIVDGKPIIYQGELTLNGRFIADIKSKISAKEKQETTVKQESQKIINRRIQSKIDEEERKITQIIEENVETAQKLSEHEQTIDYLENKMSHVEELTREASGFTEVTVENCANGNLLELHITGNNTVFDSLYVGEDVLVDDETILFGDSIIGIENKYGEIQEYELGIEEVLRYKNEVYDEFIYENGKATIVRRIGIDENKNTYVLDSENIEELSKLNIVLNEDFNRIFIKNYTADLYIKYAIKSEYTEVFSSKVEMASSIKQTANEINLEVSKKVGEDEIISKINQSAEKVKINANHIELEGVVTANEYFKILEDGSMECKNGTFKGDIFLKNGGKVIGGDGMLSNLQFSSSGRFKGYTWLGYEPDYEYGSDFNAVKDDVTIDIFIPENFTILSAFVFLEHSPAYWYHYDETEKQDMEFYGYSRNIKLYKILGEAYYNFSMAYNSEYAIYRISDSSLQEIPLAFGENGYTPQNTNSDSVESIQSIDIKNYLETGINKIICRTGNDNPSTQKECCQQTGMGRATAYVIGYMKTEEGGK